MAEETKVTEVETPDAPVVDENKPSVEELMAKISQLEVEQSRTKSALDKALKEKGEITKQLRSKMTEDEQKVEAEKERDEYVASLEKQIKLGQAKERYLGMGMTSDMALSSAEAEVNGDMDVLFDFLQKHQEMAIKSARETWLADRPPINSGNGSTTSVTKEQFDKMSIVERSEFKKANPTEYARFIGQ